MQASEAAFNRFWEKYPRKTCKRDGRRAWKKVKLEDVPPLMAGLAWQAETWKTRELRYVPYPATWLNRRQWEDERPAAVPSLPPIRTSRLAPSQGWGEWSPPTTCPHEPRCQTQRSCRVRVELNERQGLPATQGWQGG